MIWDSGANSATTINLTSELAKDTPSKGSWIDDYNAICEAVKLTKCPHFTSGSIEPGFQVFRMSNCIVDDANWKAALLACASVGSGVKEIVLQRCQLEPSHLSDLALAIEKMGSIVSLKLEYLTWNREKVGEYREGMKQLLSVGVSIDYLSIRGNKLGDSFVTELLSQSLPFSIFIKAINISDNNLTEAGLASLLSCVRLNTTLEWINASNNHISSLPVDAISTLLLSSVMSADDEAQLKGQAGRVGDRNKAIKELNKKRKKGGQVEIPELALKAACVVKIGAENRLVNQSLSIVDLSQNPIDLSILPGACSRLRESFSSASEAIIKACQLDPSSPRLSIYLRGCGVESIDPSYLSIHAAMDLCLA